MTEQRWLNGENPGPLLEFVRYRISDRKARLFAVACCRRIRHLVRDPSGLEAVQAAELFADGAIDPDEFAAHREHALQAASRWCGEEWRASRTRDASTESRYQAVAADWYAAEAAAQTLAPDARQPDLVSVSGARRPVHEWAVLSVSAHARAALTRPTPLGDPAFTPDAVEAACKALEKSETRTQADLLREVIENPFHPPGFPIQCRTRTVLHLAQYIYDEERFDQLPELAAALKAAGCGEGLLLEHLETPDLPHVKGCWALDRVLGFE